MKEKIYYIVKKIITPTFIKVIILLIPIIVILFCNGFGEEVSFDTFFDIKTFVVLLVALICQAISTGVVGFIEKRFEDDIKLTTDYSLLIKKYSRETMLEYNGTKFPTILLVFRLNNDEPFEFEFNHSHCSNYYQLPAQVALYSDHIMKAHSNSKLYNRLNIRIDDFKFINNKIELIYSRTYYYDSMITNRAIDYRLPNGKTIRDIYEPGPFLSSLSSSKFSNHFGFNGFIELSDGKIVFILRDRDVSIGKHTLGCSIEASVKSEYALNDKLQFDQNGLNNAIINEIKDEINLIIEDNYNISEHIFAFCRNVLEGGRPQFIFYLKINNISSSQFKENFKKVQKRDQVNLKKTDGSKVIFLSVDELKESIVLPDKIILPSKKKYKMMPLSASSIVLLLNHISTN